MFVLDHSSLPSVVEKGGKSWLRRLKQGKGEIIETPALCSHTGQPQGYRPLNIFVDDSEKFEQISRWCCAEHRIEYLEALYEQTFKEREYFYDEWVKSREICEKHSVGSLAPADIVFAATITQDYSGSRIILAETGEKGWTVYNGSHCSCWGFDDKNSWDVDEYTGDEMKKLMEGWSKGTELEREAAQGWNRR